MTITADAPIPRIRARHPKVDFAESPKYWVLDDPQSTHSLNILHFGIPVGERYFVDGVRLAMPYITDAQLLDDARGFIGQEVNHARMHEKAAEHLDLFTRPPIGRVVAMLDARRVDLYRRVDSLPEPLRRQAVLLWVCGVALAEHLTTVLADIALDDTRVNESAVDPEMAQLIRWHAAEELEHRSVAFDVYQHAGGTYALRAAIAVPAFVLAPIGLIALTNFLMLVDPDVRRPWSLRRYIMAVRARRIPSLLDLAAKMPAFLLPNHHPSKIGHDDRAAAFLASSPRLAHERVKPRRRAGGAA